VDWYSSTAAFLGSFGGELEDGTDLASGVGDHRPRQPGNLAGPQPGLDAQQHHHSIAVRVAPMPRYPEHATNLSAAEDFGGLPAHGLFLSRRETARRRLAGFG
jgi:hypothetical protein